MTSWIEQIPLPLWLTLAFAATLVSAAVFALARWFRLKAVKLKVPGAELEFERNTPNSSVSSMSASGISQEVVATQGGSIQDTEQNAEGDNIQQKIHGQGQISGVKQNAKNR